MHKVTNMPTKFREAFVPSPDAPCPKGRGSKSYTDFTISCEYIKEGQCDGECYMYRPLRRFKAGIDTLPNLCDVCMNIQFAASYFGEKLLISGLT